MANMLCLVSIVIFFIIVINKEHNILNKYVSKSIQQILQNKYCIVVSFILFLVFICMNKRNIEGHTVVVKTPTVVTDAPVVDDTVVTDPVVTDPVVTDPVVTDPVVTDPVVTVPVVTDPVVPDAPVVTDPVVTDPVVADPVDQIDDCVDTPYNADSGRAHTCIFPGVAEASPYNCPRFYSDRVAWSNNPYWAENPENVTDPTNSNLTKYWAAYDERSETINHKCWSTTSNQADPHRGLINVISGPDHSNNEFNISYKQATQARGKANCRPCSVN